MDEANYFEDHVSIYFPLHTHFTSTGSHLIYFFRLLSGIARDSFDLIFGYLKILLYKKTELHFIMTAKIRVISKWVKFGSYHTQLDV